MSVIKDLSKLQQLMGGAAAASPTLAAAVPAAVEKLADCLDAQQRQLYINADVSSADAGAGIRSSSVTQSASGAAGGNSAGFPVSSGPFPSPRSSPLPAAVQLLTNSLQERIPDVQVITTTDQLRQLIERLQKHQVCACWHDWQRNGASVMVRCRQQSHQTCSMVPDQKISCAADSSVPVTHSSILPAMQPGTGCWLAHSDLQVC